VPESPQPPGAKTVRRISWDILRVVAVLAVVLGHVTHQGALLHPELSGYPFRVTAQFGAAILLVISAFFVCASRIARLLPAYFVAVAVTYVVTRYAAIRFSGLPFPPGISGFLFGIPQGPPADPSPWYIPTGLDLLANLTMVQAWGELYDWFYYLDGSYWTLPVQLMAFSGAALLWPRAWRTHRKTVALLWALILVPVLIRFVIFDPDTTPKLVVTIFYGLGLHRVHVFAIGVAIWLWSKRRLAHWHLALFVLAAVAAQDLHVFPRTGLAVPGPAPDRPGRHLARRHLVWSLSGAPGTGLHPGPCPAEHRRSRLVAAARRARRRGARWLADHRGGRTARPPVAHHPPGTA